MTAPYNTIYADGGAPITADGLNTFVQSVTTVADARAFIGTDGMQIDIMGYTAPSDGGAGTFYWNATGTGPDDNGVTNIVPSGAAVGCWTRLSTLPGTPSRYTGTNGDPSGTTSTAGVMMGEGGSTPFIPNKSGQFLLIYNGQAANNTSTQSVTVQMRYGTGAAPTNGAALTGTVLGGCVLSFAANNQRMQFSIAAIVTGLMLGTSYWLDVSLGVSAGTGNVYALSPTILEL